MVSIMQSVTKSTISSQDDPVLLDSYDLTSSSSSSKKEEYLTTGPEYLKDTLPEELSDESKTIICGKLSEESIVPINLWSSSYQKQQDDVEYRKEFVWWSNIEATGWDSLGYWWKNGQRETSTEFYVKLREVATKHQNWRSRWKFKGKVKHFSMAQRREFALYRFLQLIESSNDIRVRRFGYFVSGYEPSVTLAEAYLRIYNWKIDSRKFFLLSTKDVMSANQLYLFWNRSKKEFGV